MPAGGGSLWDLLQWGQRPHSAPPPPKQVIPWALDLFKRHLAALKATPAPQSVNDIPLAGMPLSPLGVSQLAADPRLVFPVQALAAARGLSSLGMEQKQP